MKYLDDEVVKKTKLKLCPLCGSEAEIAENYHADEGYSIYVGCPECFCRITKNFWFDFNESSIRRNLDVMVKKWNTRHTKEAMSLS